MLRHMYRYVDKAVVYGLWKKGLKQELLGTWEGPETAKSIL